MRRATGELNPAGYAFKQTPPFSLGNYVVVKRLGQGGMGEVFVARHDAGALDSSTLESSMAASSTQAI